MYTLKKQNNSFHLYHNNQPKFCPYQSAPVGDQYGLKGFAQNPCTSLCSLFDIQNIGNRVKLHCGQQAEFIAEIETDKPNTNSPILNINGK
jgi:hypothetical protein